MGTPQQRPSRTLFMIALLIAVAAFSVMTIDLNSKYNNSTAESTTATTTTRSTTSLITVSADKEQSAVDYEYPTNAIVSTNATINDKHPKGSHLWIFIELFSEGMATWRISLAQILQVAKTLNATLVEPCIGRGRLTSCGENDAVGLDQVYDTSKFRQVHSQIVSYDDYQAMLAEENPVIVPMCFHHPKGTKPLEEVCGNLTNMF
ncbi:hypothetical protein MHU86_20337 [Fragilaria crotonensis]|nr:hypothetical protein MHU86_20337 [Fragilaria crotonensis]